MIPGRVLTYLRYKGKPRAVQPATVCKRWGIDKLTAGQELKLVFRNEPHSSGGERKSSRANCSVPDAEALAAGFVAKITVGRKRADERN